MKENGNIIMIGFQQILFKKQEKQSLTQLAFRIWNKLDFHIKKMDNQQVSFALLRKRVKPQDLLNYL